MMIPNDNAPTRNASKAADLERAWVDGVRNGDVTAFEQIFQAYNRQLYRFAFHLVGSPDDAEDVVQAVFVTIWDNRATWTIHRDLRVYLFTAVRNRVFRQLRNTQTRRRLHDDVLTSLSRFRGENDPTPDVRLQHREFADAVERAVAAMPARMREAFLLTREHGMTYEQVAATMGVSAKTVTTHISRALAVLRKAVAPFLTLLLVVR